MKLHPQNFKLTSINEDGAWICIFVGFLCHWQNTFYTNKLTNLYDLDGSLDKVRDKVRANIRNIRHEINYF